VHRLLFPSAHLAPCSETHLHWIRLLRHAHLLCRRIGSKSADSSLAGTHLIFFRRTHRCLTFHHVWNNGPREWLPPCMILHQSQVSQPLVHSSPQVLDVPPGVAQPAAAARQSRGLRRTGAAWNGPRARRQAPPVPAAGIPLFDDVTMREYTLEVFQSSRSFSSHPPVGIAPQVSLWRLFRAFGGVTDEGVQLPDASPTPDVLQDVSGRADDAARR